MKNGCISFFLVISIVLAVTSFVIHIMTFSIALYSKVPEGVFFLMHFFVIINGFPSVTIANRKYARIKRHQAESQKMSGIAKFANFNFRYDYWGIVLKNAPKWLKTMCIVFGIYAFFNFMIFLGKNSIDGSIENVDGKYVMSIKGEPDKEVTKSEYDKFNTYVARGFSGHWMIFSLVSTALLVSSFNDGKSKIHKNV